MKTADYKSAQQTPFIQAILANSSQPRTAAQIGRKVPHQFKVPSVGNIDLMVLRPENQNQTTVTPFIDYLSEGLFRERLHVLGKKMKVQAPNPQRQHRKLLDLLKIAADPKRRHVEFTAKDKLQDEYWNRVTVNHEVYEVGFISLLLAFGISRVC